MPILPFTPVRRLARWPKTWTVLICVLCSTATSAGAESPQQGEHVVVFAGTALLGPGNQPRRDVIIEVRDEHIVTVSWDQKKPTPEALGVGTRMIDLSCCHVMPGLIDTQTHLESQPGMPSRLVRMTTWSDADFTLYAMENARHTLLAGFTTIRDMGHHGRSVFAVRDAIERGAIPGPRMQVAGEVIRPTGGELRSWVREDVEALYHVSAICDGAADCKRAVRAEAARGATTIKVETKQDLLAESPSQFDLEELVAIREAAHALGLKVTASAFSGPSIRLPLEAGFDAIVHVTYVDEQSLALARRNAAYFIPTLLAARVVREIAEDPSAPVSVAWRKENLSIYHGMLTSFARARKARIPIAFGTDAGWREHGRNAEQLVQMVELGMSPEEALQTATIHAARAMGWEDRVGTLEVGKYADLIASSADPLSSIETLMAPVFVMKGGVTVRWENSSN